MEDVFYYLTLENDNYVHPEMPEGVEEGILKGCYRFKAAEKGDAKVHLWGSGAIFPEALRAQQILAEKFKIGADVWSVTSYGQLRRDAIEVERWNRLHPTEDERKPLIAELFADGDQPIIAASDYMKVLPDGLTPWLPGRITSLGTDGFGRSESRDYLRRHFEVSAEAIAAAALSRLARQGKFDKRKIKKAFAELGIDTEAKNPATA
jgi:pyruvate dehydrogenase E1 component